MAHLDRLEEALDMFAERDAKLIVKSLEQGKGRAAKRKLLELRSFGVVAFSVERREEALARAAGERAKVKRIRSLERLWYKIQEDIVTALRHIKHGELDKAIPKVKSIREDIAAEFAGEVASERKAG
jgi:hypothetical protein